MTSRYVINGRRYRCALPVAKAIAKYDSAEKIFVVGKSRHWFYVEHTGRWILAEGGLADEHADKQKEAA